MNFRHLDLNLLKVFDAVMAEGNLTRAAERLRAAVLERTIAWQDGTLNVTVSTGVACATLPTEAVDALLRRADDALYRAKAQGRNRVEVATQKAA